MAFQHHIGSLQDCGHPKVGLQFVRNLHFALPLSPRLAGHVQFGHITAGLPKANLKEKFIQYAMNSNILQNPLIANQIDPKCEIPAACLPSITSKPFAQLSGQTMAAISSDQLCQQFAAPVWTVCLGARGTACRLGGENLLELLPP